MPPGSVTTSQLFLKARPTPAQLADRLAPPVPAGMELYLDARDIEGPEWLARLRQIIAEARAPDPFTFLVEGPIRSLDGSFFDVTQPSAANQEVLRRLVLVASSIGAPLVNIHLIAPVRDREALMEVERERAFERAIAFLQTYVRLCREHGLIPAIENIPPVARMREGAFMYSLIGVEPLDVKRALDEVDGLSMTLDTSHAQLYINAVRGDRELPELQPLSDYYRARRQVDDLDGYIDLVGSRVVSVHVSNAAGMLGEGLPYGEGVVDLDPIIGRLAGLARYIVTETLEPDPERALLMREAQARMAPIINGEAR